MYLKSRPTEKYAVLNQSYSVMIFKMDAIRYWNIFMNLVQHGIWYKHCHSIYQVSCH